MVILRIELDEVPGDQAVYLESMGPNDTDYHKLYLFSSDSSAISRDEFAASEDGDAVLVVPVFASAVKTLERANHAFATAGTYSLKLEAYDHGDPRIPTQKQVFFESDFELGMPSNADVKYFEIVGQEWAPLLGITSDRASELNKLNGDILGLALVAHIVESTRREGDPTHGKSEWADPLYDLAFAVPDSSYAPYVAYYAACSYMWQRKGLFVKTTYGFDLPDRRFADLEYYKKAQKALELAVNRGDPYIKPFAVCFLGGLKTLAGDFSGARTLIQSVEDEAQESPQVADLAGQVKRLVEKLENRD